MNQFYQAVDLLKSRLSGNPNVNTVLFGRTDDKDLYKKNIYPIAHIIPTSANVTTRTCTFSFEVAALDQRDISKEVVTNKFLSNDDLQDNLNVTYAILNDLVSWLTSQNNDYFIEMTDSTGFDPILFKDYNLLDGWVSTITLTMPNTLEVCASTPSGGSCANIMNFSDVTISEEENFVKLFTLTGGNLLGVTEVQIIGQTSLFLNEGENTLYYGLNIGDYTLQWRKYCNGQPFTEWTQYEFTIDNEGIISVRWADVNAQTALNLSFPVDVAQTTTSLNINDVNINSGQTANDIDELVTLWNSLNGDLGVLSDPQYIEAIEGDFWEFTLTMAPGEHRPQYVWIYSS